jgi:hypothetical protein
LTFPIVRMGKTPVPHEPNPELWRDS